MREHDLSTAQWRKSSYSSGASDNCIEVADNLGPVVPVRDSKNPDGPAVIFSADAWAAFLATLKA
ncbi:DUF397 domain-containing protein [Streptomyces niger]|uniref:DUF397 domain-containing protein n=1 Tax=Streptomyces niger TaxID=66373 RepID=UPI00069A1EC4|nr:DUF397 domain-containing protein [Streptomyces niger]